MTQSIRPLVMLDVGGTRLQAEDRELLRHPATGGLILFSRNYAEPDQLRALMTEVRDLRADLLVAVDQEGGRVQRFREGFTRLPPMAALARRHAEAPREAVAESELLGRLMASELRAFDIDISFAPVLDLDHGVSEVIGDRSFGATSERVIDLAGAWIRGMNRAGMAATGKHFPGHGAVAADSHTELPVDERPMEVIEAADLQPFRALADRLGGIMPAHVVYSRVDERPAGFSPFWLRDVLRRRLGFKGVIFSDDLAMAGAAGVGGYTERAEAALDAGCDMVLVCNDRPGAEMVLEHLERWSPPPGQVPALRLRGGAGDTMSEAEMEAARRLAAESGTQDETV